MNPETLLAQMAPLRAPEAISWWPPAPGWWLLLAAVLIALALLGNWWLRRFRKSAYRRQALAALNEVDAASPISIGKLNVLLKATALRGFPEDPVAALHGREWLTFLEATGTSLSPGVLDGLAEVYQNPDQDAPMALVDSARRWIKSHKVTQ